MGAKLIIYIRKTEALLAKSRFSGGSEALQCHAVSPKIMLFLLILRRNSTARETLLRL